MDISYKVLAAEADISEPYACQLLSDDPLQHREPSRDMALKIYEATSLQLGFLKNLNADDAATMLELEKKDRAA